MVVKMKMMRWPPWPPLPSRNFEVVVVIHRVEGLNLVRFDGDDESDGATRRRLVVEIKWKGRKTVALRRSVARNFTEEGGSRGDGAVEWNEEFKRVCGFSAYQEGEFLSWEVAFTVFNGLNHGSKDKVPVLGTALLNLAKFISSTKEEDVQVKLPLMNSGVTTESSSSLLLSLRFTAKEPSPERQRPVLPILWSPCSAEASSTEKPDFSMKAGLRKMKTFKDYVSTRRGAKKESHRGESSDSQSPDRNQDAESNYPFDTDSLEDDAEGESEESREDTSICERVNYETLPYANWVRGSFHSHMSPEDENLIYYSHRRSDVECSTAKNSNESGGSEQSSQQSSKKRMLSWRKRKLSFRSPKPRGEPLLKKDCWEEGGDDIDFDRRQLSSSDESISEWFKSEGSLAKQSSDSEFGDDNFVVGTWESKEVISRDGLMKLRAQVFFASIDQRSERAAGESACTALVAVIANWLQSNRRVMPTRSEFDSLIREGSLEWRNLYLNEEYRERFPDKHFDLETILQAKIRPICVVPEKSFIGFFHPEDSEEEKEEMGFEFLQGVMSFDSIWEEISKQESDSLTNNDPVIYIVTWNDHFFVLLVDHDAYYIIDTLGERLYEGCDQAYVLKFDKDTKLERFPANDSSDSKSSDEETSDKNKEQQPENSTQGTLENNGQKKEKVVSRGKGSCKEYIKSFLAAIPIRQLKADMKRGMVSSAHHRLQIEFHYTKQFWQFSSASASDVSAAAASLVVV